MACLLEFLAALPRMLTTLYSGRNVYIVIIVVIIIIIQVLCSISTLRVNDT